ncbi:LPS assembly lipoprotein LptE [Roseomonas sp. BN140053]|uniref:LPS assembly lipoprotein LptE n=1 Tax=Roseomonas sp. BN140053 TaxID=3391898 RepID=UPI0039EB5B8A
MSEPVRGAVGRGYGARGRDAWARRGLLAVLAVSVAGCGFQPLHAPGGGGERSAAAGVASADLAAVRVGLIPERNGQLLRRALQQQLESGGTGTAARYSLSASLQAGVEMQGFLRSGTPTRQRITFTAPWSLSTLSVPPVVVASGTERAFDAANIPDNQFFAADVSTEAAQQRLVQQLAADIVEKVAVALSAAPAAPQAAAVPQPVPGGAAPRAAPGSAAPRAAADGAPAAPAGGPALPGRGPA